MIATGFGTFLLGGFLRVCFINVAAAQEGAKKCVCGVGGGGTQTRNLCTFGKEPI